MIDAIQLRTSEYANPDGSVRRVEQIAVHMMDMWLYKDVTCERDEQLAQRAADEAGIELIDMRDGANAPPPATAEEQLQMDRDMEVFACMLQNFEPKDRGPHAAPRSEG